MLDLNLAVFLAGIAGGWLGYVLGYERGWSDRFWHAVELGGRVVQGEEE